MINIRQIYDDAVKDPSLFAKIDIDAIIDSLENDGITDYLEKETLESIQKSVYDCLREHDVVNIYSYCQKLADYRYVEEICHLHKGKNVRWMRKSAHEKTLTNGGIVVDIKFLDNGMHILTKNNQNRFIQYKFDDCLTFQKMSLGEQLVLMANGYV
jgi:CRISPR/Cas system-associated endoribonuclease Cas2